MIRHFNFHEVIEASPKPKNPQELVVDADKVIRDIFRFKDDPENLSKAILDLAVISAGLGNHLADIEGLADESKAQWDYLVGRRKLELVDKEGKSATVAESKAELEHFSDGQKYRQLKKAQTMLKLKRNDIDRIFEGGRSRLSVIKNDLRQV